MKASRAASGLLLNFAATVAGTGNGLGTTTKNTNKPLKVFGWI